MKTDSLKKSLKKDGPISNSKGGSSRTIGGCRRRNWTILVGLLISIYMASIIGVHVFFDSISMDSIPSSHHDFRPDYLHNQTEQPAGEAARLPSPMPTSTATLTPVTIDLKFSNSTAQQETKRQTGRNKKRKAELNPNEDLEPECFQARPFDWSSIPSSALSLGSSNQSSVLPQPWIHIGMPKTGTTTLEKFWKCGLPSGNHIVSHSTCMVTSKEVRDSVYDGKGMPDPYRPCPSNKIAPCQLCGSCMKHAKNLSLPLLESCGNYTAWAQMDTEEACYFPQLSALEAIHREAPHATFVFMFRNIDKWVASVQNFKKGFMLRRFRRCQFPYFIGHRPEKLKRWFCRVVKHARRFVAEHPSHRLLEINLDDPESSLLVNKAFGLPASCWGRFNVNTLIHNTSLTIGSK